MTTEIEWVHDLERLTQVTEQWRSLVTGPFTSPDWLLPWWDSFSGARELRACLAWRGGELVGVAAMSQRGNRLESLVNVHTPYFDLAVRDEAARAALVEALAASSCACVAANALPSDSPTVALLADAGHRRSAIRPRHVSPIVDTSVASEEFRAASMPRWGAPLDRFRRKMIREHAATFHLLEQPTALDAVLDRGFAVEASGWKGGAGTAILSDPSTERFYRAVAHAFASRRQLALSWLCFGNEMVAFDLDLLVDRRLYLLKTGFDERYRRLAPGLVLRLALIERCLETDIVAHELLGDDSEWKRKFAAGSRQHLEIQLFRRGFRGSPMWVYRRYAHPMLRSAYRRTKPTANRLARRHVPEA